MKYVWQECSVSKEYVKIYISIRENIVTVAR
jgi:hypothetical protein